MLTDIFVVLLIISAVVLLISLLCFALLFFVPRIKKPNPDVLPVPNGKVYEPYHEMMKSWIKTPAAARRNIFTQQPLTASLCTVHITNIKKAHQPRLCFTVTAAVPKGI